MQRKLSVMLVMILVMTAAVFAVNAQDDTFTLTIMHTNDVHAAHEPDGDGNGGQAILASVIEQIRAEGGNNLLIDAGDRFTGSLFHTQYLGQDSVQIMNLLGYDVMVLGNHEFDNGDDVLREFVENVEFPVITANMSFEGSPLEGLVQPSTILEVGGEQIGVVGLVAPDSGVLSSPGPNLVFFDNLTEIAQAEIDALTEQGINKIVLLTHIGINADQAVIEGVTGADIVIGGHSHTLLSNSIAGASGEYPLAFESAAGEPVIYVQAGANTEFLGRLDVEFDADGVLADWEGDTIFLSRYIAPNAEMADLVTELAGPIEELRAQPVGESAVFLVGDRTVCRVEECNLGNLITDAVLADTGADIVIQNGGGIRADIAEGTVTLGDVLTVLPFGNLVSTMDLTGADVIAALENGVSQIRLTDDGLIQRDGASGRFPQVAGISYTFDPTQEPGSRIVEVLLADGSPIDPEATYFVATNDFMRNGGDGYVMFAENAMNPYDFGKPLDQVVADYIAENAPVAPEVEGRITATVGVVEME